MSLRCEDVRHRMALFLYEDLPSGEMGRVGLHIGGCGACGAEYRQHRRILDLLDRFDAPPVRVDLDRVLAQAGRRQRAGRVLWLVRAATAAAAVLLLAALPAYLVRVPDRAVVPPAETAQRPQARPLPLPDAPAAPAASLESSPQGPAPVVVVAAPLSRPNTRAARQLLWFAALDDTPARAAHYRGRLEETGVDVDPFLVRAVETEAPAPAGAALCILQLTSPPAALHAVRAAIPRGGALREQALEILAGSGDPRARGLLVECFEQAPGDVAWALAARGTTRDAAELAECLAHRTDAAARGEVWSALRGMGRIAAEPVARIVSELPEPYQLEAIPILAEDRRRGSTEALQSLLQRPLTRHAAALVLGQRGDAAALEPLVECARSDRDAAAARDALASLARQRPQAMLAWLRGHDRSDEALRRREPVVAGLAAGNPEALAWLVREMATDSRQREDALRLAAQAATPEAVAALLSLGVDRTLAPKVVDLAVASLGSDAPRTLVPFLNTRYGAAPAQEALCRLTGVNRGGSPVLWMQHLRASARQGNPVSLPYPRPE